MIVLIYHFLPDGVHAVLILKLVKDTITPKHHEVLLTRLHTEVANIRLGNHNVWVAEELRCFRLDIAKGATDAQTAGEHSVRTQNNLRLLGRGHNRSVLVDLPTIFEDPVHLDRIGRLVVVGEGQDLAATSDRHHGTTVSRICHIANIVNNEHRGCTGA